MLGDQQCSGFRAVGSSCLNTSSDHNSKNVSDELQTCSVFSLLGPETLWSDSQHLNLRVPIPLLSLMYVGFRTPCHLPAYSGALCSSSVKKWFLKVQNINTATITYFLPGFATDSEVEGGRRHSQISSVLLFELECGLASD